MGVECGGGTPVSDGDAVMRDDGQSEPRPSAAAERPPSACAGQRYPSPLACRTIDSDAEPKVCTYRDAVACRVPRVETAGLILHSTYGTGVHQRWVEF